MPLARILLAAAIFIGGYVAYFLLGGQLIPLLAIFAANVLATVVLAIRVGS